MTQNTAAAALRADLAGPRVSAARLYSAAEIIGHAADRLREYAEAPPIGTIAPWKGQAPPAFHGPDDRSHMPPVAEVIVLLLVHTGRKTGQPHSTVGPAAVGTPVRGPTRQDAGRRGRLLAARTV